jgi:molybdenum cofactor biosynthesis enzyme MoaA
MTAPKATTRPVPTIPRCGGCNRQRVLYGGLCQTCVAADERESDQQRETAREARKGYRRERDR